LVKWSHGSGGRSSAGQLLRASSSRTCIPYAGFEILLTACVAGTPVVPLDQPPNRVSNAAPTSRPHPPHPRKASQSYNCSHNKPPHLHLRGPGRHPRTNCGSPSALNISVCFIHPSLPYCPYLIPFSIYGPAALVVGSVQRRDGNHNKSLSRSVSLSTSPSTLYR
jgi:hypothetical protein